MYAERTKDLCCFVWTGTVWVCFWYVIGKLLTVIGLVALDETPSIDVDYHAGFTALASQHIEATDVLTECLADLGCIGFLAIAEMGDKTGGDEI